MSDSEAGTEQVVDFTTAKQRAEWQKKEVKAQALKQQFQRAMGWQGTKGKATRKKTKAGPKSAGPRGKGR